MDQRQRVCVVFDYTSFLEALTMKKWTFMEAILSVYTSKSLKSFVSAQNKLSPGERLWQNAIHYLSAYYSDELNLLTLFKIARSEGIDELRIMMPYMLDEQQLENIEHYSDRSIHLIQESDELTIEL